MSGLLTRRKQELKQTYMSHHLKKFAIFIDGKGIFEGSFQGEWKESFHFGMSIMECYYRVEVIFWSQQAFWACIMVQRSGIMTPKM